MKMSDKEVILKEVKDLLYDFCLYEFDEREPDPDSVDKFAKLFLQALTSKEDLTNE